MENECLRRTADGTVHWLRGGNHRGFDGIASRHGALAEPSEWSIDHLAVPRPARWWDAARGEQRHTLLRRSVEGGSRIADLSVAVPVIPHTT